MNRQFSSSTTDQKNIPGALSEQFKTDYATGSSISLYVPVRPPTKPSFHCELDAAGIKVEEKNGGRLKRCYLANPEAPESAKPDVTIVLGNMLQGGIRESTSQVWAAEGTFWKKGTHRKTIVAKFFDPLYLIAEWSPLDAIQVADRGAFGEYNAYTRLSALQKTEIPEFFGLFLAAFPLPVHLPEPCDRPASRNVYVVLMEYVDGIPLDKVDPRTLEEPKEATRDHIMDEILEIYGHALALGVEQCDFAPRNVLLRKSVSPPSVVMIDFERIQLKENISGSWDNSVTARRKRIQEWRGNPLNPDLGLWVYGRVKWLV